MNREKTINEGLAKDNERPRLNPAQVSRTGSTRDHLQNHSWRNNPFGSHLKLTPILLFIFIFPFAAILSNDKLDLSDVNWYEGFENGDASVAKWASNGDCTVNYIGISDEKSFSGEKSLKIDVTFNSGNYFYWSLPVDLPIDGKLRFEGHLLVEKGTTGRIGLGINILLPPTDESGCRDFDSFSYTRGKWKTIQGDILKLANSLAGQVAQQHIQFAGEKDVGKILNRVGIFLRGHKGQRVVAYIDDLRIKGLAPDKKKYLAAVRDDYDSKVVRRFNDTISAIKKQEEILKRKIEHSREMFPEILSELNDDLKSLDELIVNAASPESFTPTQYQKLQETASLLSYSLSNWADLERRYRAGEKFLAYILANPISSLRVKTDCVAQPLKLGTEINLTAALGEFESCSLVVSAMRNLDSLSLRMDGLESDDGKEAIPSGAIDIRIVEPWYQSGTAWHGIAQDRTKRVLVPELLVHDGTLVKLDHAKRGNSIKLTFGTRERYWRAEDPVYAKKRAGDVSVLPVDEFPIRDAKRLLPEDLAAGTSRQFWVTVHVPEKTAPGYYKGAIRILSADKEIGAVSLNLHVLSFRLPMPKTHYDPTRRFISSIYYRGKLDLDRYPKGSISSEWKSKRQLRAEFLDMWNHNIFNPTCYQGFKYLRPYLEMRKEIGTKGMDLLDIGISTARAKTPAACDILADEVRKTLTVAEKYGFKDLYVYGIDEARGHMLALQRQAWMSVRKAGGKVFVAGYKGAFSIIGDVLDMQIQAGTPSREDAEMWHRAGHKILSYANPQAGPENPEVFRRNFGLYLWLMNYDGAMTYCYQHSFGNIYDDFDNDVYRDHVFSYPTVDGVIPTLAIEGYREGIDDIRYATLLASLIAKHSGTGDPLSGLAAEAGHFLKNLDTSEDLSAIRNEIIRYILKLRNK